ncbi:hypothetical protein RND71_020451 [Anisodus tanguticus]|uniref:Uncharacterized protein n=1 Tax=Anisodus tanguticus TaxID=243964 RepID=A0AAE1RZA0_9SOLA|nr:hypothetical protein RND71_020451 [Anisodus tanguticus]
MSCPAMDNEGKGCVFTYDVVGSYERVGYSSQGSGATLIMPFLYNQLKSPSPLLLPAKDAVTPLSESEAIDLVKTCFASATERDIYEYAYTRFGEVLYKVKLLSSSFFSERVAIILQGDSLEIVVLNADGVYREEMDLRRD